MMTIGLILLGLLTGIVFTILLVGRMMRNPSARIWLSDRANWSNTQLPQDCDQLVRHGKWIASHTDREDT